MVTRSAARLYCAAFRAEREDSKEEKWPVKWSACISGRIVNNIDLLSQGRAMVRIPAIAGASSIWAPVCRPFGASSGGATIGGKVVVAFDNGDPDSPVILGSIP